MTKAELLEVNERLAQECLKHQADASLNKRRYLTLVQDLQSDLVVNHPKLTTEVNEIINREPLSQIQSSMKYGV